MGDEHHGLALVGPLHEREQLLLQDFARLRVERRERLVHQQDRRVHGERPHQAHALLHAAGELIGIVTLEAGQADQLEIVRHPRLDLRARRPRHGEPEGGVVVDGLPGEQAEMLEHHGNAVGRPAGHRLAMDEKLAAAEIGEAGDTAQQRGLAAAGGTHDAHDLVAPDRERQLMEGDDGAVEEKFAGAGGDDGRINRCFRADHAFPHSWRRHAPCRRRALISACSGKVGTGFPNRTCAKSKNLERSRRQVSGKNVAEAMRHAERGAGRLTRPSRCRPNHRRTGSGIGGTRKACTTAARRPRDGIDMATLHRRRGEAICAKPQRALVHCGRAPRNHCRCNAA